MHEMIEDSCLPDGQRLIGGKQSGELVSAEGAERNAEKTEDTRKLSGKLHRRGMMAVHTGLFNPGNLPARRKRREKLDPSSGRCGRPVVLFSD